MIVHRWPDEPAAVLPFDSSPMAQGQNEVHTLRRQKLGLLIVHQCLGRARAIGELPIAVETARDGAGAIWSLAPKGK